MTTTDTPRPRTTMVANLRRATALATLLGDHGYTPQMVTVSADGSMDVQYWDPKPSARLIADVLDLPVEHENHHERTDTSPGFSTVTTTFHKAPLRIYGRLEPREQVAS